MDVTLVIQLRQSTDNSVPQVGGLGGDDNGFGIPRIATSVRRTISYPANTALWALNSRGRIGDLLRAVVLGASGFIGRALTSNLIENGYEVLAIYRSRPLTGALELRSGKLKTMRWDSIESRSLSSQIKETGWTVEDRGLFFDCSWSGLETLTDGGMRIQLRNVPSGFSAVEESQKIGCHKFVFMGSEVTSVWKEEGSHQLGALPGGFEDYALAKVAAWDFVKLSGYLSKTDVVCASFSTPIGLGMRSSSFVLRSLHAVKNGQDFEEPTNSELVNFISVTELADGIRLAGELGRNGESYSLIGPSAAVLGSLFQSLKNSFGMDSLGPYLDAGSRLMQADIEAVRSELGFAAEKNLGDIFQEIGVI